MSVKDATTGAKDATTDAKNGTMPDALADFGQEDRISTPFLGKSNISGPAARILSSLLPQSVNNCGGPEGPLSVAREIFPASGP